MIVSSTADIPAGGFDFTIIGSGFAGLYLAETLERAELTSLVIEQGPLDQPLNEGKGYYEIDVTGLDYLPLSERLAAFGGTSGHWAGMSRPLAPSVFEERSFLKCPGWPITYGEFASHLDAAKRWLHHTWGPSDATYDEPREGFLPGATAGLEVHNFVAAKPVRRLNGELKPWIRTSKAVHLLPSHRVVDLRLDEGGARVGEIDVVQIDASTSQRLSVNNLLLTSGGIENARLMLASGRKLGPGNPFSSKYGRTGLAFMEHPKYVGLEIYFDERFPFRETGWHDVPGGMIGLKGYTIEERLLREFKLPRFAVFPWGGADEGADVGDGIRALDRVLHGSAKRYRRSLPEFEFEQTPRDTSYIALSERTDRHGQPLARMHWTMEEDQLRAFWKSFEVFAALFSQTGSVRIRPRFADFDTFAQTAETRIQHHHMGTTAMSHDATTGVVDTNCKVHGVGNLHVAGCSVFPTADYVNPTLNIVALADRLARHLITTHR